MSLGIWVVMIIIVLRAQLLDSLERRMMSGAAAMSFDFRTGGQVVLMAFEVAAGLLFAIAVHEAAHVLVGVWAGFRFDFLRVSRLQIDRHFRISLCRKGYRGTLGLAGMHPVKIDALAWRGLAMLSAGAAANLATGFAVLLLPIFEGALWYSFVLWSLAFGFGSLLPFQSRKHCSDGMRILTLLRSRERGEQWLALMNLRADLRNGVTPASLSSDFLAKAIAVRDASADTVDAYVIAYRAANLRQDDAKAGEYLEALLQYASCAPPARRQALMIYAAIFQATRRGRVDLAEQWLAELRPKTRTTWLCAYVEAMILGAKGDIEGTLKKLNVVEELILTASDQQKNKQMLRSVSEWKSRLESGVASPPQTEEPRSKG